MRLRVLSSVGGGGRGGGMLGCARMCVCWGQIGVSVCAYTCVCTSLSVSLFVLVCVREREREKERLGSVRS